MVPSGHRHSILVVEDDAACRESLALYLEAAGFVVRAVEGGSKALAALDGGFEPCIAIVDAVMPGMDGWELVHRLQSDGHHELPVVMLTGMPDVSQAARAVRSGLRAYLVKPPDLAAIERLVAEHCRRTG